MDLMCLFGLFPKEYEDEILRNSIRGIQNAANNYQWALVKGLDSINDVNMTIANSLYIGSYPKKYRKIRIPDFFFRHGNYDGEAKDQNIGFINIAGIKAISRYYGIKKVIDDWAKDGKKDKVLMAYAMTTPFVEILAYVTRKYKEVVTCLVVPDLPEYMNVAANSRITRKVLKKIQIRHFMHLLRPVDGYVLLTQYMNEWFDYPIKSTVVEGISLTDNHASPMEGHREKVILYAGMIEEKYGVVDMVKSFTEIDMDEWKLEIYGRGTAENIIKEYAKEDPRIKYLGVVPNETVRKRQKEVSVLINPRSNNETFTKYSFPSKVIEYMGSGTPMIGYKLSGMPDEYLGLFYNVDDYNANIKSCMLAVMSLSEKERKEMGNKAMRFITENKNPKMQCQKIVLFLEDCINEKKSAVR